MQRLWGHRLASIQHLFHPTIQLTATILGRSSVSCIDFWMLASTLPSMDRLRLEYSHQWQVLRDLAKMQVANVHFRKV